jgi:hypothetical protein
LVGFQLAVAVRLDCGEVNKHILTTITTDEAISFGGIEPLYGSDEAF